MARNIKQGHVRNPTSGAAVSGATVTVYKTGTSTLVTIYAASSGGSAISGSQVTTNANGYYKFYIDKSNYNAHQRFALTVEGSGLDTTTYSDVDILDKRGDTYNVADYGATGDGTTDDRSAIQAAIDAANTAGGGVVEVTVPGTYLLGTGGTISSRAYGLLLKSNVTLDCAGSNLVTFKSDASTEMDMITTARATSTTDIACYGFKMDGNEANQSDGKMNMYIMNTAGFLIDDVYSVDPGEWGFGFETVTYMLGGKLRCTHSAETNADGVHFRDSSNCTVESIDVYSLGDDAFAITAENTDVHDITIGSLIASCPVVHAATTGRGVYIGLESGASTLRSIYNIKMPNVLTYNCNSAAVVIGNGASCRNINVNFEDYGSAHGLFIIGGIASPAGGYVRNCEFNFSSWSSPGTGMTTTDTNGAIEYNRVNGRIYDPGSPDVAGIVGVQLYGDYWTGGFLIDYDPAGTKTNQSNGLDIYGSYNDLGLTIDGANINLYFRSTATDNTIRLGYLANAATTDIEYVASGNNNRIIGGEITGAIVDNATGNKYTGCKGGDGYGSASVTPDGNGNDTIAHGLKLAPSYVAVGIRGDNVNGVDVESVDATNITVRVKDAAGADVSAGSFTVDWKAQI